MAFIFEDRFLLARLAVSQGKELKFVATMRKFGTPDSLNARFSMVSVVLL